MERSTHTVTWQPIENDEMDLIARKNEEFNKKIKQDVELEDLGY